MTANNPKHADIYNRFSFHPANTEDKKKAHEDVRNEFVTLALKITDDVRIPDGREKALVVTKLEEAMFWANAAVARND